MKNYLNDETIFSILLYTRYLICLKLLNLDFKLIQP